MNENIDNTVDNAATAETTIVSQSITVEELQKLLKMYTNNKSIIEVPVNSEGGKANIEVVHTVTLGDIYIMILLALLLITTLLTRLIGRR